MCQECWLGLSDIPWRSVGGLGARQGQQWVYLRLLSSKHSGVVSRSFSGVPVEERVGSVPIEIGLGTRVPTSELSTKSRVQ